ncbi:hypothetical protein [Paucibacter soli]|uniref:hypothetical protein n=1 Tax=Paucibacter soli TaxID=3133433 RepID=UPI00309A48C0
MLMTASDNQAPKFSLEELAHFNRCLFPGDFERDLIQAGATAGAASALADWVRRNPQAGIVGVYQEFAIGDNDLQIIINRMLSSFIQKRDQSLAVNVGEKQRSARPR